MKETSDTVVILIGKTGSENSTLRRRALKIRSSRASVLDDPGVGDKRLDHKEPVNLAESDNVYTTAANPRGYMVFPLALRFFV